MKFIRNWKLEIRNYMPKPCPLIPKTYSGLTMIEMMMAGAIAVQIGTAIYSRTVQAFKLIVDEATDWLNKQGYKKITDIIGLAHR